MTKYYIAFFICITSLSFSQNPWQGGGGGGNMKGMMEKMKVGHIYGKIVDSTSGKPVEWLKVVVE